MPELEETEVPKKLPSLVEQAAQPPKEPEWQMKKKKRPVAKDAQMADVLDDADVVVLDPLGPEDDVLTHKPHREEEMEDDDAEKTSGSKGKTKKSDMRRVPVPPHRVGPLKDNWVNIFTPIVKQLGLQVRFNTKRSHVEIRNPPNKPVDVTFLQKGADFVRAFILGFEVNDAVALVRLDHLFLETFEVADVRFTLKGDNKARAIGRIAGRHGRTRLLIENVTKTRIIVANNWIHILGGFNNIRVARHAICSLILGYNPSKVYGSLRGLSRRMADRL